MTNGKEALKQLEKITSGGKSRYYVFEDWLNLMLYALIGDEENYLKIATKYNNDRPKGERNIDYLAKAFAELMKEMSEKNNDILGEIYMQWNISNKYTGQYFTPRHIANMMAEMNKPKGNILDPTCGSGVMLVEAAKVMDYEELNKAFFVGQDLDISCVKMCALNLLFFNLNGYVIQGNTLAVEYNWGYRTIRTIYGGEIREMTKDELEVIKPKIREAKKKQAVLF